MVHQRFRPPPHWPSGVVPLGLGLGGGALLFLLSLGLRGPVLVGAVVPPWAAGWVWRRRQAQLTSAAIANGELLDPWVLRQRLLRLRTQLRRGSVAPPRWEELTTELERIRQLAACCAELDPTSTVSLLLLLEGLLDRLQPRAGSGRQKPSELVRYFHLCRLHLASVQDEALRVARLHPQQPILLPPLPAHLLP
jgi:hypothetical protein